MMKAVAAAILLLATLTFGFALGWASKLTLSGVNAETVLQSLTVISTVSLGIWTYRATKRKEAEARLFAQKAEVFEPLVEQLKKLHIGGKDGHPTVDEKELSKALIDIQFKAIVWGGQPFIRELVRMGESRPTDSTEDLISKAADLYAQIRRELGHSDPPGTGYDVMELLIVPDERFKVRELKKARSNQRNVGQKEP